MASVPQSIQIEGLWDEIVRDCNQLAGKRVRITILTEVDETELRRRATKLMADVDDLSPDPNRPPLRDPAASFADAVAAKLRDQGIQS